MASRPQRVLLGAILIGVAVGRDIFPRGTLALFERIGICTHDLAFLVPRDFAFKGGPDFWLEYIETNRWLMPSG
jgi:hypothetical protein